MSEPRISITPDILKRFKKYHKENIAWGILHVVLDDNNLDTKFVQSCIDNPLIGDDVEGIELAKILLKLTKTKRGRISKEC